MIPKSRIESNMGPSQISNFSEPTQGVKASLNSVMIRGKEEAKLGDGKAE